MNLSHSVMADYLSMLAVLCAKESLILETSRITLRWISRLIHLWKNVIFATRYFPMANIDDVHSEKCKCIVKLMNLMCVRKKSLLLVAQWLEHWCAKFAAQVRSWRSRLSQLITRNWSCGQPSPFHRDLHALSDNINGGIFWGDRVGLKTLRMSNCYPNLI